MKPLSSSTCTTTRKPLREVVFMDESKLPSLDLPSIVMIGRDSSSIDGVSSSSNSSSPNQPMIVLSHTDNRHQRITSMQFNSMKAIQEHMGILEDDGEDEDSNTDSSTNSSITSSQGQTAISTKSNNIHSTSSPSRYESSLSPPSSPQTSSSPKMSSPLTGLLKLALRKKNSKSTSPSTSSDNVSNSSSMSTSTSLSEKKKKKKENHHKIDLNDYLFTYEKVISNGETSQLFLKFLTMKKTSESLLFVLKFRELKSAFKSISDQASDKQEQYRNTLKTIEELYKCFFAFDSSMELNLPLNLHEPTTKIMEEYESKREKLADDEIVSIISNILSEFKKIESYLNLNLKECQFLEFLEWEKFRKFITNKGSIHLAEIAEMKPFSHTSFVESLVTEMSKPRITVKQAKQIKHLVVKNTSIWTPIITESNYIVSLSNNQYLLGEEESNSSNKGVYFFKYEITFPYPKQAVINTLLSSKLRFKFDKNTKMLSKIDYFPKEDNENLATCISQEVYDFPFPFQSREMVLACAVFNDLTDNSTMLCLRSCESDKAVKLKKTVKAKNVGCWIFQDLNGTHTRYIQFVGADFKGFLPPKLVKSNVAKRAKYYYADSLKMFEHPEDDFKEPQDDPLYSGFMDTLKENGGLSI